MPTLRSTESVGGFSSERGEHGNKPTNSTKKEDLLSSWVTISFSRRTVIHVVSEVRNEVSFRVPWSKLGPTKQALCGVFPEREIRVRRPTEMRAWPTHRLAAFSKCDNLTAHSGHHDHLSQSSNLTDGKMFYYTTAFLGNVFVYRLSK